MLLKKRASKACPFEAMDNPISLERRIALIEGASSFSEIPPEVLPTTHKEDYYFVSYSHKDYKEVLKDLLLLEEKGINIWYDAEMHIGENWQEVAEIYISKFQCKGVIFYLSKNSLSSKACNEEIAYVLDHNKQFFSINIPLKDGVSRSGHSMLLELIKQGERIDEALLNNVAKAFPDEVLYLPYDATLDEKARKIQSIQGESLLRIEEFEYNRNKASLAEIRDNSIISIDLTGKYQVEGKEGDYPLGEIQACAFANCRNLTSVTLGGEIEYIRPYCFNNATSLKNVIIPPNANRDHGLWIDDYAFANCTSLERIDLSDCFTIGKYAFSRCKGLKDISVKAASIQSYAFAESSVTRVKANCEGYFEHAFSKMEELEELVFENRFTSIPDHFINDNPKLKYVSPLIGPIDGMAKVGENAFKGNASLEKLVFKGNFDFRNSNYCCGDNPSLKTIELSGECDTLPACFASWDTALTSVKGMDNIRIIGQQAFADCHVLSNIDLSNVSVFAYQSFSRTLLQKVKLTSAYMIMQDAFSHIAPLTYLEIGDHLEKLERGAFIMDLNLQVVKIYAPIEKLPSENLFVHTYMSCANAPDIKIFLLSSLAMYEKIKEEGLLDGLSVLYFPESLEGIEPPERFKEKESDEPGYRKFVDSKQKEFVYKDTFEDDVDAYSKKFHCDGNEFSYHELPCCLYRLNGNKVYGRIKYLRVTSEDKTLSMVEYYTKKEGYSVIETEQLSKIEIFDKDFNLIKEYSKE